MTVNFHSGKEEFKTIDDKEFEKRYGGKLNKSGEGVNIGGVKPSPAGGATAADKKVSGGLPAAADKKPSGAISNAGGAQKPVGAGSKSIDKYEKDLKASEIRNINQTSSIHESIHDSYSGF